MGLIEQTIKELNEPEVGLDQYEGGEALEESIEQTMGTLRYVLSAVGWAQASGLKAAFLRAVQDAVRDVDAPETPRASKLPGGGMEIREPGGEVWRSEGE